MNSWKNLLLLVILAGVRATRGLYVTLMRPNRRGRRRGTQTAEMVPPTVNMGGFTAPPRKIPGARCRTVDRGPGRQVVRGSASRRASKSPSAIELLGSHGSPGRFRLVRLRRATPRWELPRPGGCRRPPRTWPYLIGKTPTTRLRAAELHAGVHATRVPAPGVAAPPITPPGGPSPYVAPAADKASNAHRPGQRATAGSGECRVGQGALRRRHIGC